MRNQPCDGCLTMIRQGFTDGVRLFCTQFCEQDFYENGGRRPIKRKRAPRASQ